MSLKLLVQHRTVYGKTLTYPCNETGQVAADLLRKKTFSDRDLELLQTMGFVVEWVPQGETAAEDGRSEQEIGYDLFLLDKKFGSE